MGGGHPARRSDGDRHKDVSFWRVPPSSRGARCAADHDGSWLPGLLRVIPSKPNGIECRWCRRWVATGSWRVTALSGWSGLGGRGDLSSPPLLFFASLLNPSPFVFPPPASWSRFPVSFFTCSVLLLLFFFVLPSALLLFLLFSPQSILDVVKSKLEPALELVPYK